MRKYTNFIILLVVAVIFFYKTVFFFQIPFPGDLLISEYAPWKYERYLGYNPGSYPNKAQYFDVIRQLYPWKMLVVDEIKAGRIPLWNPYNFSGSPLLANHQSSVFNPFNVVFFILTPSVAWSVYILIQPFLASLFMYIFLRQLKLKSGPSLLGSIAYGYSLFMSTFLEYGNFGHTIMYLPLGLFLIEKINLEKKRMYPFFFPFAIAFIIFAGHLQLAFSILIFFLIYILFHSKKKVYTISLLLLGIGISSVQLIPTFELIRYSARVPHEIGNITQNFLLQFHQLLLFISPDSYGNPATRNYLLKDTYPGNAVFVGIAPLLFAFISLWQFRKNKYITYFGISFFALLLLLTNNPVSYVIYSLRLPFASSSAPSNFIFLMAFCLCALSALGADAWLKNKGASSLRVIGLSAGFIIFLYFYHEVFKIQILSKQLLFGAITFIIVSSIFVAAKWMNRRVILIALVVITGSELFYYFHKFNPFVPSTLLYPPTVIEEHLSKIQGNDRFWGIGGAAIEANFATTLRLYSPEGYDPLYPLWYAQIFLDKNNFNIRSDARLTPALMHQPLNKDTNRQKILDRLSVKYIIDRVENGASETVFPSDAFSSVYDLNGWKVMQSKTSWPRAFVIPQSCIDERGVENCMSPELFEGVRILSYNPTAISIASGTLSGMMVLSDAYYPGWQAHVDGVKKEVVRLESGVRGIDNIRPQTTVILSFHSTSFNWGLIVTIISIVGMIAYVRMAKNEK